MREDYISREALRKEIAANGGIFPLYPDIVTVAIEITILPTKYDDKFLVQAKWHKKDMILYHEFECWMVQGKDFHPFKTNFVGILHAIGDEVYETRGDAVTFVHPFPMLPAPATRDLSFVVGWDRFNTIKHNWQRVKMILDGRIMENHSKEIRRLQSIVDDQKSIP